MDVIARAKNWFFSSKRWQFFAVVFALLLVKTGIWPMPNLRASQRLAHDPFLNPISSPMAQYVIHSWLSPFLAWLVGFTGRWSFLLFHFALTVAGSALFAAMVFRRFAEPQARTALLLFCLLPAAGTTYFWVGIDSMTLFLILLAFALPGCVWGTLSIGVLLGLQHFEQGFCGVFALMFATCLSVHRQDEVVYSRRFCFAWLLGIILGKCLLIAIFHHADMVVASRWDWLQANFATLVSQFFYHFHVILWSVLGLGWWAVLRYLEYGKSSLPFFLAFSGLCLLLLVSGDQTRVLAIVSLPLILQYWLLNEDFLQRFGQQETVMLFLLWAILPWCWVWEGAPKWSALPYNFANFLQQLGANINVPHHAALWPFQ